MDQAALVANDRETEARVIAALSRTQIPVTAVEWHWVADLDERMLVIVTALNDTHGPRESYARIFKALRASGMYQGVGIRNLYVRGPEDALARELIRELKLTTQGTIHIAGKAGKNGQAKYSMVFSPYLGSGGAIPSVSLRDDGELRSFLEKRLGVPTYAVNQAVVELAQKGAATIFNVPWNLRRAKRLNLAA